MATHDRLDYGEGDTGEEGVEAGRGRMEKKICSGMKQDEFTKKQVPVKKHYVFVLLTRTAHSLF